MEQNAAQIENCCWSGSIVSFVLFHVTYRAHSGFMVKWHTAFCDGEPLGNADCFDFFAGILNYLYYCLFTLPFGQFGNMM